MITVSTEKWKDSHPPAGLWELAVEECLLWEEYRIRPGMRLCVQNLDPLDKPATYRFEVEETAPFELMCFMSGRTSITMTDCHGVPHAIENRAGDCSLCHLPGSRGGSVTHAGERVQAVGLLVMPDLMCKAARDTGILRGQEVFSPQGGLSSFVLKEATPPHLSVTAREVLGCPLEGAMRQVFMEYKAMELLFILLQLLDEKMGLRDGITPVERNAALRARDVLLSSIMEPPSLQALARRVGLTHTRLNAVFQLLFGVTVFSFLREKRLEHGRRLLAKPRQGVAETAYDCGFSSPSHFTRAFSERYGVTPSRYRALCLGGAERTAP